MGQAFSSFLNVCVRLFYRALKPVSHKPYSFVVFDPGPETDALYTRLHSKHRPMNGQSFLTAVVSSYGWLLFGVIVVGEPLVIPLNNCFHIRHATVTYFDVAFVTNFG